LTLEDGGRLAECLNSFDDSDSWPGGFTHGNPFTAQRVLDDWKKRKDIRVIVAYTDDKIVGHCNVCEASLDKEAAYVGLLGVNPQYQGQGFGKALLIEAAETAAREGKRRIDLHTWGGNLKALPLYKRTGYNWVPRTRVLMESHIPGIINNPMFKAFFERYDWYDSYKREIRQEMDDIVDDNLGIYNYRFEGENGDLLVVTVDREAKGICGFQFNLDGKSLAANVRPKTHTGYIGYGETPVELIIENGLDEDLTFSVEVETTKHFEVRLHDESSGSIANGARVQVDGVYTLSSDAEPVDREVNADEKVTTNAEWELTLGTQSISLFSGLIPTEAIIIKPGPFYPCLSPWGSEEIGLGLTNNLLREVSGELQLVPPEGVVISKQTIRFKLKPGQAKEEPLSIKLEGDIGNLLSIGLSVHLNEEEGLSCIKSKSFMIPVIGHSGAVVYRNLDDTIIFESNSIRAVFLQKPGGGFRSFEYKPLSRFFFGWGILGFELGYPFPAEGGELTRLTPEVRLENHDSYAEVIITCDSQERPGLSQTITYRINAGSGLIETSINLENTGNSKIKNLGVRLTGWMGGIFDHAYVPLRGEIYDLASVDWGGARQLPKSAKEYHETWIAMVRHQENHLIGFILDPEHAEDVRLIRGWRASRAEYRLPDLGPGETITKTPTRMFLGDGDWRKVRSIYRKFNGISDPVGEIVDLRLDVEVEIVPKSSKQLRKKPSPILVDRSTLNNHELRLRLIHEEPIEADIRLKMPNGLSVDGKDEVHFKVDGVGLDKPFTVPLKIEIDNDESWLRENGELEIQFKSRIVRLPLTAVVFDSKLKIDREVKEEEGFNLHTLKTGGYTMSVSPEYLGGLVRYGLDGEPSAFFDTFPEVKPFIWWDKFYSGLSPILVGWDVWDWETGIQKESWSISDTKAGAWVGYETTSTLQHSPGLKGISVTYRYLLLPGTPLLSVEASVSNTSNGWKRVMLGFRGVPRFEEEVQNRIHTIRDRSPLIYETHSNSVDIWAGREGWGAFENPKTGDILGVISSFKWDEVLYLDSMGDKGQMFGIRDRRPVKPGDHTKIGGFILLTDNIDSVGKLQDLPDVEE
jgi:GNAT superfamily N-acetyltransferase